MKLSLKKRFGFTHIRGGRILDVAHDHQVTTNTQNISSPNGKPGDLGKWAKPFTEKWVTAKVGDLAIELVVVKTGTVIGYSYLSGDALQLNLYRHDAPAHWFTPVVGWRVNIDPTLRVPTPSVDEMIGALMQCKYARSPVRLVAFEVLKLSSEDEAMGAARWHQRAWSFAPVDMTDAELAYARAHMVAQITAPGAALVNLHFQPPYESSPYCMGPFLVELVFTSTELETKDPYTNLSDLKPGELRDAKDALPSEIKR